MTVTRSPDVGADGGAIRRSSPRMLGLMSVAAAVVLPDQRSGEGADLAECPRVQNGTEPGDCIGQGDGGVA